MAMLDYDFMRSAFVAAAIVAVVAGACGYFLVLRQQAFAGHALSHVGFTGATGAVLVGVPPLWGLVAASVAAGGAMGWLGTAMLQRDVAVGMVLTAALGLGLLFLHFFTSYATEVTALLFGNVLAVDVEVLRDLLLLGAACLGCLALIARPLLFATLQPEVAEARGVRMRLVSTLFLGTVALATAACTQVVGVLLVFTLLVGPGAAAQRLTARLWMGIGLSVVLALVEAWAGIAAAYYTDWPTSFWIATLSAATYGASFAVHRS